MLTVNVNLAMMEPAVRTVSHTTHITVLLHALLRLSLCIASLYYDLRIT